MKKQANFGHVLTMITIILSLVVTPLIVWGVSIEKRDQKHSDRIESIEQRAEKSDTRVETLFDKIDAKMDVFIEKINTLHIDLQNKQNRKE